ncbi:MAG: hypothetical protein ACO3TI_06380 [Aquiluna sp.]|jgi:hypothetical protein
MNIWNWITANWTEIVAALGGIVLAARIIVKLTPTPADDSALEKVVNFLKTLGLHIK